MVRGEVRTVGSLPRASSRHKPQENFREPVVGLFMAPKQNQVYSA
jgi:hypothetical protein